MLKIYMIKATLKFVLAIGLLYWLLASGKLDFSLVKRSIDQGPQWIFALILIVIQAVFGAYRYKRLLQTRSKVSIPFLQILRLNYIGLFFSSVLPGAVTGDLIKVVYVKKLDDNFSKTFLITVTLLDRILGLTGLLFLTGIFSMLYYPEIHALSPKLSHLIYVNFVLFAGAIAFLLILLAPAKWQKPFLKIPKLDQLLSLRENRKDILACVGVSIVLQFLSVSIFWILTSPFYTIELPLKYAFTFVPIGLITTALPISPGGLGVGHALFENLFGLIHINGGASLFNLYFLCYFAHNFLGFIPYILRKRD